MRVDTKLILSKLLTIQADQLIKLLDTFEGNIPKLVEDATTDQKLEFYKKITSIYTDKLNRMEDILKNK